VSKDTVQGCDPLFIGDREILGLARVKNAKRQSLSGGTDA
jgi:hypothetical protein